MTEPSHAVFLSYASQDAEAAQRICEALRAAGIEVWFDQSELRGGDAWDQKIRRELRDCALFMPVISANTVARHEGYFRLEWDLADQRTHKIARNRAFIVPVCVDATPETSADIPESFQRVQWTRLPGGETPVVFVDRLSALLAGEPSVRDQLRSGLAVPNQPVQAETATPLQVRQKTIAVLPFEDLSEKKDQEYFADGIAEEILNLLGRVPGLRVIARTSSFGFRGKGGDLRGIGTQLGAGFVVEGSVRQSGGRVRINARLIDTTDGVQRWSESYVRDVSDVLRVQEQVATSLVSALHLQVAPDVFANLRARPASTAAYEAWMRGGHAFYRLDRAGFQEAIAHYRRALELDPSFVAPAESLAGAFDLLAENQFLPPSQGFEQARAACNLALQIDPKSPLGHGILGNIHTYYDWDRAAATREINTALQLAPNDPVVLILAGKERLVVGDWTESLRLFDLAISLDPLQPLLFIMRGLLFQRIHRNSDAKKDFRRVLEINPAYRWVHSRIAELLVVEGSPEAALAELEETVPLLRLKGLALVNHALKKPSASDAALARLESEGASIAPMSIAEVYAFREQIDEAFEWLERAIAQKEVNTAYIKGNALLRPLLPDPRYARCLHKMNLTS